MYVNQLLALLPVLLLGHEVYGAPVSQEPLAKVVLRRIPMVRSGENVAIAYQRHQNSAMKRLHRFTGEEPPPEGEFEERMLKRHLEVEETQRLEKRKTPKNLDSRLFIPDFDPSTFEGPVRRSPKRGTGRQAAAAAAQTTIAAGGSNADGFSEAALDATQSGTITDSTSDLVTGGVPYNIEMNDIGYIMDVQIGTPPKTFTLLADTGSGDTWVPSSTCTQCGNHNAIGTDTSSSFQGSNNRFQVTYGSGAVAGLKAADNMVVAGMTLRSQPFGVATAESQQFSSNSVPFDGLMGLSFSSLSNQQVATPIEALQQTGQVQQAVLGIALGRFTDGDNNGELVFGQADTSKLDASTTQTLAVSSNDGFWQVAMAAVTVNGRSTSTNRQAILDTGTSLMIAPEADADAFHAQIQGAQKGTGGMYSIPCTTDAVVTMTFGNAAFQIDARDLLFQPLTNNLQGNCISSLSAGTVTDASTWLLGDSFLKNVYMTTNVQDKTVQLSARTDAPLSSSFGKSGAANATAANATNGANASNGTSGTASESGAAADSGHGTTATGGALNAGLATASTSGSKRLVPRGGSAKSLSDSPVGILAAVSSFVASAIAMSG